MLFLNLKIENFLQLKIYFIFFFLDLRKKFVSQETIFILSIRKLFFKETKKRSYICLEVFFIHDIILLTKNHMPVPSLFDKQKKRVFIDNQYIIIIKIFFFICCDYFLILKQKKFFFMIYLDI